ncbi:hypothetical protein ACP70R_034624 [Stipagrostis hirtigluma subsp. patula]
MDPTRYWILARRKLGDQKHPLLTTPSITVGSHGSSSACYNESWEERAFAEDSAGHLGGCIWPPRSYSCSFCGREFRSAQALGGHMNVHRRDRARLKLSGAAEVDGGSGMIQPCPRPTTTQQQSSGANLSASDTGANPNLICSVLAYPSRYWAQAAAARSVLGKQVLSAPLTSMSACKDDGKKEVYLDSSQPPQDCPRPAAKMCPNPELRVGSGELKLSVLGCRTRRDFIDASDDEDIVHVSCKRRRIDLETSPLILRSPSRKHHHDYEDDGGEKPSGIKVLNLCPATPIEELDLELRLGEAPTVK